jgi:hypothetical protein
MHGRPDAVSPSVRVLHHVVQAGLQPLGPGADVHPADRLGVDVGDPDDPVLCEQRRQALVVVHHHRVGGLAPQRLDPEAIANVLNVVHRGAVRGAA